MFSNDNIPFLRGASHRAVFISALLLSLPFVSISAPVRSNLGGDSEEYGDVEMYTAADYVQDGLVAMWDGIENAGWRIHDSEATTWVNLCGTGDFPTSNAQLFWESDALVRYGKGGGISCTPDIDLSDPLSPRTFEFVMDAEGIPLNPSTTTYYFWALNNAGVRATCHTFHGVQGFNVTLRNQAGAIPVLQNTTAFPPLSVSMVGTDEPAPQYTERNIALYYLNGDVINKAQFGGNATDTPSIYLFRWTRDWPETMRIGMHCFRIYNRALTPEEVYHNYLIDKERFGL